MDERQGVPSCYFNRGFHGSGSFGLSVDQVKGPQVPPGFQPQSNPSLSSHSHSNVRLAPSLGTSVHLDHIEPPRTGFPHAFNLDATTVPRKKRGRPRKIPAPAVGTHDPTTPRNKRGHPQTDGYEHLDLSKLKPPSRSGGFRTGEAFVNLLKSASAVLISGIKEAANANEMIELSSKAFIYFDSIGIDYMPVYKVVCSVIHHQYDKEVLAKRKPYSAFDTKVVHDQAIVELSGAKERYTSVNRELEDAQCDFDAITAHLKRLSEEIKRGNEKSAKLEAKVAAARADKVTCYEAYSKAKSKLEIIAPKMSEAQKAIDEFERRWKETVEGLNRAMEETTSLRI